MRYLAWAVWISGLLVALGYAHGIRHMTQKGQFPTNQTIVMAMLFMIGVVAVPTTGASPFHLLWYFPLSFLVGTLTLPVTPLWMLRVPAGWYCRLCCWGIDWPAAERKRQAIAEVEERYLALVKSGMQPDQAQEQAVAEGLARLKAKEPAQISKGPSRDDLEWIRKEGIECDPEGHYESMTEEQLTAIWHARLRVRQLRDPRERAAWQQFRGRDRLDDSIEDGADE